MSSGDAGETHRHHLDESVAYGRGVADAGHAAIMLAEEARSIHSRAQVSGGIRIRPSLSERAGYEAAAGLVAIARESGASIFHKVPACSHICGANTPESDICMQII